MASAKQPKKALTYHDQAKASMNVGGNDYTYYSLPQLKDDRIDRLPYSIRVLLESNLRNYDNFTVKGTDLILK